MNLKALLSPAAIALALLAAPTDSRADHRKVTVYRDRDHDGHYNKKTYSIPHDRHSDRYRGYGYGYRPYGYGYRPYDYGYSPYYYGYGYPRTSFGVSVYSQPSYRTYRTYDAADSLAADVQSALRRRGYYRGAIDGDIGPGSRAAIRAYQREHGLAATGRIDASLLRSLRID